MQWLFLFLFLRVLRARGLHRGKLGRRLRRRLLELYPASRGGDLWRAVYRGKVEGATATEQQEGKEALEELRRRYPDAREDLLQRLGFHSEEKPPEDRG